MCERRGYSGCVRRGGGVLSFARRCHCNEKSVDGGIGEVTAYDEPDWAAVGGVGER